MKISKTKRFEIKGTDAAFVLRNPTDQEYNDYYAERFEKNNIVRARAALFDELLVEVENLEDDDGVIGIEQKDRIPAKLKAEAVFIAFDRDEVDLKNS